MKKVLLTGGTGFIGRNVLPVLQEKFQVLAPGRSEVDWRNGEEVQAYLERNPVDVVYHCANPNPVKNPASDTAEGMVEDSLRIFLNLYHCRDAYGKMVYLGSGAEYDKRLEISNVQEKESFRSIPQDAYGFAKYITCMLAEQSDNIYNLCLFACYGPGDHESKFITHCIRCCLNGEVITIRQDCRFDYIQVSDLGRIMVWMGENQPQHHKYNVSGCQHVFLSEIAQEVNRQMDSVLPICILSPGLNQEYTADGSRLWTESGLRLPMTLREGIEIQIKWEKEHFQ